MGVRKVGFRLISNSISLHLRCKSGYLHRITVVSEKARTCHVKAANSPPVYLFAVGNHTNSATY